MNEISLEHHLLGKSGISPNNDALPLILYKGAIALGADEPESDVEKVFWGNDWGNGFRGDTFTFHHYHSSAHEVVGCSRGTAQVQFGGPEGPVFEFKAGDAVLIPAGVVHRRCDDAPGYNSVGAYPPGQVPDCCVLSKEDARIAHQDQGIGDLDVISVGKNELGAALARIAQIPLPVTDPIAGAAGPVQTLWHQR